MRSKHFFGRYIVHKLSGMFALVCVLLHLSSFGEARIWANRGSDLARGSESQTVMQLDTLRQVRTR